MCERGRSMVEMLGVLAIIGVLSIGGIAGYNIAINKYRANELLEEGNKRALVIASQIQNSNSNFTLNEFTNNDLGYAKFDNNMIIIHKTTVFVKAMFVSKEQHASIMTIVH